MGNTFDDNAATWDEKPDRIERAIRVWNVLNTQLDFSKIQHVMDYGCGTGLLGYQMIDMADRITFCDTSKRMLEQVEMKRDAKGYQNVKTLFADLTQDDISEDKFDLIVSMLVLHHVEAIEKLLESFYQILNKGGKFAWIDLDEEDGSFHHFDNTIPHNGFSKSRLEELMKKFGFKVVFYSTEVTIFKEIEGGFKEFPLFVMIAEKV